MHGIHTTRIVHAYMLYILSLWVHFISILLQKNCSDVVVGKNIHIRSLVAFEGSLMLYSTHYFLVFYHLERSFISVHLR